MFGDRHVHDSSTVVREDDEYEEQPEGPGGPEECADEKSGRMRGVWVYVPCESNSQLGNHG